MTGLKYTALITCPWCLAPLPDKWLNNTRWRMARRGGCPECRDTVAALKARHKAAQAAAKAA